MQQIRVLQIVTYMGRGGLETMLMNYYRCINREKIQFDFLVHRDFEADYDEEILQLGGKIYRVPMLNPFSTKYHKALDTFFSQHHYEIVHSHLDCLSAYPLRVAKKYGANIRIAHAHNKNQDKNFKYLIKKASKLLMPYYATHLFACSEEAGQWMFGDRRVIVMNNAIDAKQYVYNPNLMEIEKEKLNLKKSFVIGHIGRFSPQKNHTFLIDVFAEVVKYEPSAILLLIGVGNGMELIREKVEKLGIKEKVFLLGMREDVSRLLQAVDVFVFPSLYEGLGIAAIEAQAAGIPCVLSDQVPEECKIAENVEFLSLNESADFWAKHICEHRFDMKTNQYETVCSAGYDIINNAKWLEDFYTSGGKLYE